MMGGAVVRRRLGQLCNYLKNNFASKPSLSVASNFHTPFLSFCLNTLLKADSGASKHFVRACDASQLEKVRNILNGPSAKLPNNTIIQPSSKGYLPYPSPLSDQAKEALIYPDLKNASLLSIRQLCDDNCLALFHKKFLWIIKDNKVIITGLRNPKDNL